MNQGRDQRTFDGDYAYPQVRRESAYPSALISWADYPRVVSRSQRLSARADD